MSGTTLSAQARYAAGTREIFENWFTNQSIRVVARRRLVSTGKRSYTAGGGTSPCSGQ